ncbi:hypothetical protein HN371_26220 [Candidatus Poribacteria bacterium]|jgi:hypothetical protein|nr:hypothetical protein [Candidatus Poribacteria bacterium]MBT7805668.1 hypothetical protein [Candidatus Poribacteria bacterium]
MLSEADIERFVRDGYVVVTGLIPPEIVVASLDTIWRELSIDPADDATWPESAIIVPHEINPLMKPCRTPDTDVIAERLAGPGIRRGGGYSPVINFPRHGPTQFEPMGFHIDGIDVTTLWPGHRYMVLLAYLTDTCAHGGATAVRPGSHRVLFEHWLATGTTPNGATSVPDIDYPDAVAVPGEAGDVVFMHYLLAHGSSHNRDGHPRVALNGVVAPATDAKYTPKIGPPTEEWTPIDHSLRTDTLGVGSRDDLTFDSL